MTIDLKALRAELLQEEIRQTRAEADMAELDLIIKQEQEADRQAKPGYNRALYINDAVVGHNVDLWIGALEHWERRLADIERPITVTINSPGGSVMDGLALYDTMQRLRRKGTPIITRATGLVASMATILLQAGDERIADKNVQILVHEMSSRVGGKVSGIADEAAFFERLNDRLFNILGERSTLSARQIKNRANRKEWWIDADEALKLGFVDRVE